MTRFRLFLYGGFALWLLLVACVAVWAMNLDTGRILERRESADGSGVVSLLSTAYRLDRVYMSMTGPHGNHAQIQLSDAAAGDETLWVTSVESDMVDADSLAAVSNEFFCHANLTLNPETTDPERHNASLDSPGHADWRLFTLIPGRMSMRLPAGFGLPIKNATLLDYFTMALQQNPGPERDVRMQTRIAYQRSVAGQPPPRALFRRALYVYQQYTDKKVVAAELPNIDPAHLGEFCAENCPVNQQVMGGNQFGEDLSRHPGASCCVPNASVDGVVSQFGLENTTHWIVPPGRHQYRSEVTPQLRLPFDTTVHYVTGHLHPLGKSLRLVDLETGETVFEITSRSFEDRLGVDWMSEWDSTEGVPIHAGRRYALIAEYDNTLDHAIDAMGIMYLYALDEPPAKVATRREGNPSDRASTRD